MKDKFPGYFKEDNETTRGIWDECLFVFDANVLLNFYRYSEAAKNEFFQVLEKIKDRIWIPHQAAEEYLRNRTSVITSQKKTYKDTLDAISDLRRKLDNSRQHPFVSSETMERVHNDFSDMCAELEESMSLHEKRIYEDEIKEKISGLFDGRVGDPFNDDDLKKMISKGQERYDQKIPPGFKDSKKSPDTNVLIEQCRKFGDYIIWEQIISKSKEAQLPVIFITDDKKDDWWLQADGKTIGPRPELKREFLVSTNNQFLMYQSDRFLEFASNSIDGVSDSTVLEIRETANEYKYFSNRKSSKEDWDAFLSEMQPTYRIDSELDLTDAELIIRRQEISDEITKMNMRISKLKDEMVRSERLLMELSNAISLKKSEGYTDDELKHENHEYFILSSKYSMISKKLDTELFWRNKKEEQLQNFFNVQEPISFL